MDLNMRNLSLVFVAGCWGALLNSLAVWLFGALGIAPALGVHIAPALTPAFLYPKLVWGGLWGFLFLIPLGRRSFPARGLLFSLGPTLVQLFVVFPSRPIKALWACNWAISPPSWSCSTMPSGGWGRACG